MKIALLISGYLRSFKDNIESIKANILNFEDNTKNSEYCSLDISDGSEMRRIGAPTQYVGESHLRRHIDIYIHVTKTQEKKYLNEYFKIDDIYKFFNPKIVIISDNINFCFSSQNNTEYISNQTNQTNQTNQINYIYNQNYKFWLLNNHRKEIEKRENIKYDLVVKMRPDVNLQEKIPFLNMFLERDSDNQNLSDLTNTIESSLECNNNNKDNKDKYDYIYIPSDAKIDKSKLINETDPYLCDIMAYGPPHLMDKYFDIYQELDNLIPKYGDINETLLYHHLTNMQIPYKLFDIKYIVILSKINTIAITGDSGSGKTNLSNILKRLFYNSFILECDRYHKWERGDEKWQSITHLNPEANYITKMRDDVFDLKIGRDIYQVDYDHKTGKFTDKQIIENKDNIIICGLHTLYLSDHIIDLKIFIDTEDSIRIPWKIKRDIAKRGYTIERILKQIQDRKPDYEKYILPQRECADIIVSFYNKKSSETLNIFSVSEWTETDFLNKDVDFEFKIGINKKYNLNDILREWVEVKYIEYESISSNFYWIYFNECENFENIITQTILRFFAI